MTEKANELEKENINRCPEDGNEGSMTSPLFRLHKVSHVHISNDEIIKGNNVNNAKKQESMTIDESLFDAVEDAPPGLLLFMQRSQSHNHSQTKQHSNTTILTPTNASSMCALSHDQINSSSVSKNTNSAVGGSRAFASNSKSSLTVDNEALEKTAAPDAVLLGDIKNVDVTSNVNDNINNNSSSNNNNNIYNDDNENNNNNINSKNIKGSDDIEVLQPIVELEPLITEEFAEVKEEALSSKPPLNNMKEEITAEVIAHCINENDGLDSLNLEFFSSLEATPTLPNKEISPRVENKSHKAICSLTCPTSSSLSSSSAHFSNIKMEKLHSNKTPERTECLLECEQFESTPTTREKWPQELHTLMSDEHERTPVQRTLVNSFKHKERLNSHFDGNPLTHIKPHALSLTSYTHLSHIVEKNSQSHNALTQISDHKRHSDRNNSKKTSQSYCDQYYKAQQQQQQSKNKLNLGVFANEDYMSSSCSLITYTPDTLSPSPSWNAIDQLQEAGWFRWKHTHLEASLSAGVHSSETSTLHKAISSPPTSQTASSRNEALMISLQTAHTNSDSCNTTQLEIPSNECSLKKNNKQSSSMFCDKSLSCNEHYLSTNEKNTSIHTDFIDDNDNNNNYKNKGTKVHKSTRCPVTSHSYLSAAPLLAEFDIDDTSINNNNNNNNNLLAESGMAEEGLYRSLRNESSTSLCELVADVEQQNITELANTRNSISNKLTWSAAHWSTAELRKSLSATRH